VQGKDGNFYGTLGDGGPNGSVGTVFRMTRSGDLTNLVSFHGTNGDTPNGELVLGADGSFYGTTSSGGAAYNVSTQPQNTGLGTMFRMTTNGTLTTLVSFTGTGGAYPGAFPYAGLIQGNDGAFYGTTRGGGTYGSGTVFRLTAKGMFNTLYSFDNTSTNGYGPSAGLLQGADSDFYGTTSGTVFRLSFSMQPTFQTVTQTFGTIVFTWTAMLGFAYQLQYTTNLNQPSWNDLGGPITADTGTITASDFEGADVQRFYRVVLLP